MSYVDRIAGWTLIVLAASKGVHLLSAPDSGMDVVTGLRASVLNVSVALYELALGVFLLCRFHAFYKGALLLTFAFQVVAYKAISITLSGKAACSCLGILSQQVLPDNHAAILIATWLLIACFVASGVWLLCVGNWVQRTGTRD